MSGPYLSVVTLGRSLANGNKESFALEAGVNLLVGAPNTGKTKWLETLDYLLGDSGDNPFEGAEESGLAEKYVGAWAQLKIGDELLHVERRWREKGAKGKVFVNDEGRSASEFQELLLQKLGIPLLHFPKGNPMSGQTWPELSFRMLLRHIYRQQRFWGQIADQQPDAEQHACMLQFLGLAERLFDPDYGELIRLKMEVERLKARREQYDQTLEELARDLVSEPGLSVGISTSTIASAQDRIAKDIAALRGQRTDLLTKTRQAAVPADRQRAVEELSSRRATYLAQLESLQQKQRAADERVDEMRTYRRDLVDELERLSRAQDASAVLADLKVTHCPACDQTVSQASHSHHECFLCHQALLAPPFGEELGATRLRFEGDRLASELKEVDELLDVLGKESKKHAQDIRLVTEELRTVENELAPAREIVSSLVQADVSAIDVALGQASERQRQIGRVTAAMSVGADLTARIQELERKIAPLQDRVNELARATDFDAAADQLEQGMNLYLDALNRLRPDVWKHSAITVDITRSTTTFRIGKRRWQSALGGTDTLYFLMAYHFGLLTLSGKDGRHYPGITIIDLPGELLGEAVADKENFVVQPFIDLLAKPEYAGAQAIITGASFSGIHGAHTKTFSHVWVAA